jgi:hypothetical protein
MLGAAQNAALATVPLGVSMLQPPACDGTYACVESLFALVAAVGFVAAALFVIAEARVERAAGRPVCGIFGRCCARGARGSADAAGLADEGAFAAPKPRLQFVLMDGEADQSKEALLG